jgi:uncharacterized cysteine cluster protein YcgN (CxxCxxCC family)
MPQEISLAFLFRYTGRFENHKRRVSQGHKCIALTETNLNHCHGRNHILLLSETRSMVST